MSLLQMHWKKRARLDKEREERRESSKKRAEAGAVAAKDTPIITESSNGELTATKDQETELSVQPEATAEVENPTSVVKDTPAKAEEVHSQVETEEMEECEKNEEKTDSTEAAPAVCKEDINKNHSVEKKDVEAAGAKDSDSSSSSGESSSSDDDEDDSSSEDDSSKKSDDTSKEEEEDEEEERPEDPETVEASQNLADIVADLEQADRRDHMQGTNLSDSSTPNSPVASAEEKPAEEPSQAEELEKPSVNPPDFNSDDSNSLSSISSSSDDDVPPPNTPPPAPRPATPQSPSSPLDSPLPEIRAESEGGNRPDEGDDDTMDSQTSLAEVELPEETADSVTAEPGVAVQDSTGLSPHMDAMEALQKDLEELEEEEHCTPPSLSATNQQQPTPQQHTPQQHTSQQHTPQQHTPQQHTPQQHTPQQHTPQGQPMTTPEPMTPCDTRSMGSVEPPTPPQLQQGPQSQGPPPTPVSAPTPRANRNPSCSSTSSGPGSVYSQQQATGSLGGISQTGISGNSYSSVDMDHQLGLSSPTHVSAADMSAMAASYTDCAQQAAMTFAANAHARFMDTVPGCIAYSPAATSSVSYPHNSPISSYSPSMMAQQPQPQAQQRQQQQQQQPQQQQSQPPQPQPQPQPQAQPTPQQNSPRVLSSHTPTLALPGVQIGVGVPAGYPGPHCSLAKLQQLTNGIMDIVPENQMTPPPNLTTPPPVTMTPPPALMRSMTTPPVVSLHQQMSQAALMSGVSGAGAAGAKYQQRQRPSSTAASNPVRKSPSVTPNVTVNTPNPNMPFTPNVTIQPPHLQRYQMNMINGYRMQQPMVNPGYLNANFLTQLQSAQQVPMQMPVMNMNVHAQQFPQQMQQHPSQPNVYSSHYGYNLMNMNMRR